MRTQYSDVQLVIQTQFDIKWVKFSLCLPYSSCSSSISLYFISFAGRGRTFKYQRETWTSMCNKILEWDTISQFCWVPAFGLMKARLELSTVLPFCGIALPSSHLILPTMKPKELFVNNKWSNTKYFYIDTVLLLVLYAFETFIYM